LILCKTKKQLVEISFFYIDETAQIITK